MRTLEEYTNSLIAYLPEGDAFLGARTQGTIMRALMQGFSGELLRSGELIEEFRNEILPDETVLFLPEWESMMLIPDDCFSGTGSDDDRRRDILAKLVMLGIQTAEEMRLLALQVYNINITISTPKPDPQNVFPLVFEPTGLPDPDNDQGAFVFNSGGKESRFTIEVTFENLPDALRFPYTFPIPFLNREMSVIECLLNKVKPANCRLVTKSPVPPPSGPGFSTQEKSLTFDRTFELSTLVSSGIGITDTFTIAAWVRSDTATQAAIADPIFSLQGDPTAQVNEIIINTTPSTGDNDDLQVLVRDASQVIRQQHQYHNTILGGVSSDWHHVVVMWNGSVGNLDLYFDSVLTAPDNTDVDLDGSTITDSDRFACVGGVGVGAFAQWSGPIYSAGVWNRKLTPSEVVHIYNGGSPREIDLNTNLGGYDGAEELAHYWRVGLTETPDEFGLDYGSPDVPGFVNLDLDQGLADASDLTTEIPPA